MYKLFYLFILIFSLLTNNLASETNMIIKTKHGDIEIELYEKVAPNHVKRFLKLANEGKYDNVVFHRVIDGFMAQTGDVKYGKTDSQILT